MTHEIVSVCSKPLISDSDQYSIPLLKPFSSSASNETKSATNAHLRKFKNESMTQKNLLDLQAAQLEDKTPTFHDKYTLVQEIGKDTHSTVFLAINSHGEKVAVKRYEITDQDLIDLLQEHGMRVDDYVKQLALNELEIGKRTNHPHLVKIKEVWIESPAAYVVMDYIEGKVLDHPENYSPEMRIAFTQQLLSATQHLLLRNIIVDDLWSENMLISHGTHLTLIDLGGNEWIGGETHLPVSHYVEMMEHVITNIGGT